MIQRIGLLAALICFACSGGTADACQGLTAPPLPAPVMLEAGPFPSTSFRQVCLPGTSDGSGNLALEFDDGDTGQKTILLFSRDGVPLGRVTSPTAGTPYQQLNGFILNGSDGLTDRFTAVEPDGSVSASTALTGDVYLFGSVNPTGGMTAIRKTVEQGRPVLSIVNYDEHVAVRFEVPSAIPGTLNPMGFGADRQGNVFVAAQTSVPAPSQITSAGAWLDKSGNPGKTFDLGTGDALGGSWNVWPRVGDGVFVSDFFGEWIAQVDGLATTASPVPAWLAARPGAAVHGARGGTAYALILAAGADPACDLKMEVVSAGGQSCGVTHFGCPQTSSNAFAQSPAAIGYDGTVITVAPPTFSNEGITCHWNAYPGFFH